MQSLSDILFVHSIPQVEPGDDTLPSWTSSGLRMSFVPGVPYQELVDW